MDGGEVIILKQHSIHSRKPIRASLGESEEEEFLILRMSTMNSQIQTNFLFSEPYMILCRMGESVLSHTSKTSGFDIGFFPLNLASLYQVPDPVCPNFAS